MAYGTFPCPPNQLVPPNSKQFVDEVSPVSPIALVFNSTRPPIQLVPHSIGPDFNCSPIQLVPHATGPAHLSGPPIQSVGPIWSPIQLVFHSIGPPIQLIFPFNWSPHSTGFLFKQPPIQVASQSTGPPIQLVPQFNWSLIQSVPNSTGLPINWSPIQLVFHSIGPQCIWSHSQVVLPFNWCPIQMSSIQLVPPFN